MDAFLAAGGGFLVAVIWMDLMFDVLAMRVDASGRMPERALAKVRTYYRRVTTDAWPMNLLVSAVMAGLVASLGWRLWQEGGASRVEDRASLAVCAVPIALALARVFPNAVRLGTGRDDLVVQSGLARRILFDHVGCVVAMATFVALRIAAAR